MSRNKDTLAALDAVPAAMRERLQWLLWRYEPQPGKPKPLKVPYYADGGRRVGKQGNEADRRRLATFDAALWALEQGKYTGLGFAFLPGDGLAGIDIDHAIDTDTGEVGALCSEIIDLVGSYTELSPSGTGVHIIVETGELDFKTFKSNTVGVEVFRNAQYFTVTGRAWGEPRDVIPLTDAALQRLREIVKGTEAPAVAVPAAGVGIDRTASRYCLTALDAAAAGLAGMTEGGRNKRLNAEAYALAGLVHTGGISESMIRAVLGDAARRCGLGDLETQRTLDSGISSGLTAPRAIPERQQPAARAGRPAVRRPEPPAEAAGHEAVVEVAPTTEGADPRPVPPDIGIDAPDVGAAVALVPEPPPEGEGKKPKHKERPEGFWEVVDDLSDRFTLIYGTESCWDAQTSMLIKVPHMRLAFGKDPVNMWLSRPSRRMINLTDLVFEPGVEVGEHRVNMFHGLDLEPVPCMPADVDPMLMLLRHLCAQSAEHADEVDEIVHWLLCWLALPLQKIGTKMATAVIMHGPQGSGKNLFFDAWRDLYGHYGKTIGQTEIEDKFNEWISCKLAFVANEVVSRQEMYHRKDSLKMIVTEGKDFPIRGMHTPTRWERNAANIVFLSNQRVPLALDDGDRRHTVIYTPLAADDELYRQVLAFLAAGGLAKWLYYLQHYDVGDFHAHTKPPMTRDKQRLIQASWKAPARFAHEWMEGYLELPVRVCSGDQLYRAFQRWCTRSGERFPPNRDTFTEEVHRWAAETVERDLVTGRRAPPCIECKPVQHKDETGKRRSIRTWIPQSCQPPDGTSMGAWAFESAASFQSDLDRFCRELGFGGADE